MPTLRDIRRRITAVASNAKITQAMKMISAAQLRRSQEAIWNARPYAAKMSDMLGNLVEAVSEEYAHPLIRIPKTVENIALIIIASDRGLCGGFNNSLFRFAQKYITETLIVEAPNANFHIVPVGKRSVQAYKKENYPIIKEFSGIFSGLKFSTAKEIVSTVSMDFQNGKIDKVFIIYNNFKNIVTQIPTVLQLLPIVTKINGDKDKFNANYIFEPNQSIILDELLPKHLDIQIWRTLLESYAAEQAARMMAMENATKNAKDLIQNLELVFNKARQAAITKEMLEIVGGAEALKKD